MESLQLSRFGLQKIGLMEDDEYARTVLRETFSRLGYEVYEVMDEGSALELVRNGIVRFFVLDIHMGKNQPQGGLGVLESLKATDEKVFVSVLSGFPERFQAMAKRAGADVFRAKSANKTADAYHVLRETLLNVRRMVDSELKRVEKQLAQVQGEMDPQECESKELPDVNEEAFRSLMSDKKWARLHMGHFAAFVDGTVVAMDNDRTRLLGEVREHYRGKPRFVVKVEEQESVIDLPTPLSVDEA
jgi:ActR/RegA family two-component response regulator